MGLSVAKLRYIVSDTAANMKRVFSDMDWISCFLHVFGLVVKHSIFEQSDVKLVLKKVQKMIIKLRNPAGRLKFDTRSIYKIYHNSGCRTKILNENV